MNKINELIRLKDDEGNVIEVEKDKTYPKNEEGYYIVPLRKFSYFIGKETTDDITILEGEIE
jgi:hypothetical protein